MRAERRPEGIGKLDRESKFVEALDEYWRAVQDLLPGCFKEPKVYLLQRTTGVYSLHMVAPTVWDIVGKENLTSARFLDVLANVEKLQDQSFWRARRYGGDPDGASQYNGMSGFSALRDDMLKDLRRMLAA